jgi:PKD repeat protein
MTNGSGENYSHQYSTPGTYFVSLNVTDSDGQSSLMNKTAYIEVGASIFADFYIQGFPHTFEAGVKYTMVFDGIASLLPSTYAWNFGDGDFSSGTTVAHRYQRAGTYTITLTVTDSVGHTDSISRSIKIKDNGGTEPPSPGPGPVIVPLSSGWVGLLITGSITVAALGVLYLFSKRNPTRGKHGATGRKSNGKGRK